MTVKNIKVDIGVCLMCGGLFTGEEMKELHPLKRTINHGIPKTLKPRYNILFPLHLECHDKLNDLYIHNHRKDIPKIKGLNYLKSRVEGLSGMSDRFDGKVKTILKQINEDLGKLANGNNI